MAPVQNEPDTAVANEANRRRMQNEATGPESTGAIVGVKRTQVAMMQNEANRAGCKTNPTPAGLDAESAVV